MAEIYFWRQMFILGSGLFSTFSVGVMLAYPAVLNPAITSANSTDIRTTADHASWIAAINGIGGVVGGLVLSPIMQTMGRKSCHYTINTFVFIGWIIFPFANNISALYAARFIQGTAVGAVYIHSIIICEYVHPTRRGYFICLKKISIALGTLCCHGVSGLLTWRQVATYSSIPSLLAFLMTFLWPETPSYLALKGRFTECETSFKWLNGNSAESRKQLKYLIEAQRETIERNKNKNNYLLELLNAFRSKSGFRQAVVTSTMLTLALDLCGRFYLLVYIIQIMKELLGSQTSALYFSIGADVISIVALVMSLALVRYADRRTILFYSGITTTLLIFLFSLLVYLRTVYTFPAPVLWLIALLVILQCFIINVGLLPVSFAIIGEIYPLEHKGLGSCVACVIFAALMAVSIKITPVLVEHTGLYGTYSIYGFFLTLCFVVLYKIVPETKDKTLQEIEDELNGVRVKETEALEGEKLML